MKQLGRALTSLFLFVVFVAGVLPAQSTTAVVKVNIPFAFGVGDKVFPAGNYSLAQPMQHFLVLRDARGQTVASAFTSGVDADATATKPGLRFESVGGLRVLTEFWQGQDPAGQRLMTAGNRSVFARRHSAEARSIAEGSQP